jgi:formate dehydrogenase major subunit
MRRALASMRWVVVRDLAEIESATFWRDAPEVRSGELRTEEIETEVFLMPAASHVEKDGSFTNTQRLVQWRDKALEPPGDARSDLWFMHHLFKRVQAHYADSTAKRDWPIVNCLWDYTEVGPTADPSAEDVLREVSGYVVATGEPVDGFAQLEDDGTTASGCWIYSGVYADGVNQARRRDPGDLEAPGGWVSPNWAWAWPANRRVLYNRASADPEGNPWSERKRYIWWDGEKWTGYDVPDFPVDKPPSYRAPHGANGMDAISGDDPFIMMADGRGWLYAPSGLLDGPLPAHYEPFESPLPNPLYPEVHANPAALRWTRPDNPHAQPGDPRYPIVATTFRLTEHHTAGGMSRRLPWLDELQPAPFCELSPALAAEKGIEDAGWMTISSPRAEIAVRARITERMKPLRIERATVHQIALPWHWGFGAPDAGDAVNDLIALTGDPNVSIHEGKAFDCDVRAGRSSSGTSLLAHVPRGRRVAPNRDHPAETDARD